MDVNIAVCLYRSTQHRGALSFDYAETEVINGTSYIDLHSFSFIFPVAALLKTNLIDQKLKKYIYCAYERS